MSASARAWSVTERRAAWVVDIVRLQVGRVRVAPRAGGRHPPSAPAGGWPAGAGGGGWVGAMVRPEVGGVGAPPGGGAPPPVSALAVVRRGETGWCAWLSGATR